MFDKAKQHFRNNKKTYLACGVTAVVVGGITYYFTCKVETKIVTDAWKVQINSPTTNNVVVELIERSTPSKVIGLVSEDGKSFSNVFNSVGDAARKLGLHRSRISSQINGHINDVNGHVFKVIDLAA